MLKFYSNDITNVENFIKEATTEEFRKKFIFETPSGLGYTFKGKRYSSVAEAKSALKKDGFSDLYVIKQWGAYRYIDSVAILKGDEWVDFVYLQTNCKLKEQNTFSLKHWGVKVIRVYSDFKFKSYDRSDDNVWHLYASGLPLGDMEHTTGLTNKDKLFQYMPLSANDISHQDQKSANSYNNNKRYLSENSKNIIYEVFSGTKENGISDYLSLREYLKHPNTGNANKAMETKNKLLNDVFLPITEKIKQPEQKLDERCLKRAEELGYKKQYYYNSSVDSCFHRINEWIVYSSSDKIVKVFYNVKTNKKYWVNKYDKDTYWKKGANIGVFRASDLIIDLSNYNHNSAYDSVTFYKPNSYSSSFDVPIVDYEYKRCPKCFDENNNEISTYTCFEGTSVIDFLENQLENDYTVKIKNNQIIKIGTYKDIIDQNRCPGLAFLFLCIKGDHKVVAEQLYKLNLNGLLIQLLINPDTFKDKIKSGEEPWYKRSNSFCLFDKKETNLKKMLGASIDKIKIYDKLLFDEYNETMNGSTKIVSMATVQELLGDKFASLDQQTFMGIIDYLNKNNVSYYDVGFIKSSFATKTPKELLNFLNKIGSIGIYRDYISLRNQYINYFDADEAKEISKIYKIMPDKSKKFKYLRPRQKSYWDTRLLSVQEQLEQLKKDYSNVLPVYNNNGSLSGVYLNMSEKEHIRFLHDEIQEFITAHQKDLQQKGFKNAATRLLKYEYTGKDLSIVAPKESTELAIEGGVLSHCVAGFIDPVIKGTENVLFIRRNDALDKPYYTIAISNNGLIEQIHGYRNCNLSAADQAKAYRESELDVYNKEFDLIKFLHEWARARKGIVIESSIKEGYGVLGAH